MKSSLNGFANGPPNGQQTAERKPLLRQGLAKAWHWTITPVALALNRWQARVELRTRNGVILTLLGVIFGYGVYKLISLFF